MKKCIAVLLSVLLLLGTFAMLSYAEETEKTLSFNQDGTFKIMQMNDIQEIGNGFKERTKEFIAKALDVEQPDLVVFVGDQLSDAYLTPSVQDYTLAIDTMISLLKERNIPFLMTLGNHDHDRASVMSEEAMAELYRSYENCYATTGCDGFTYNVLVKSSDGTKDVFNIYIMDTNNKAESGGYSGITQAQLNWYNETSNALKEANGGVAMPSLLFQHVPVKEIYGLLKECDYSEKDAIYSRRDGTWYVLDTDKASGNLGEAPCSENFDTVTGQYQAWLENGDIMGAYFAHDHVNNFAGVTDEGIRMGYNGGTGFRSYGNYGERSVRIFELNENDVQNYTTRLVTYNDLFEDDINFILTDFFTPALLNPVMKVVYFLFGWVINLIKK